MLQDDLSTTFPYTIILTGSLFFVFNSFINVMELMSTFRSMRIGEKDVCKPPHTVPDTYVYLFIFSVGIWTLYITPLLSHALLNY